MSLILRDYQQQIVDELKYLPSSALYMSTGTGKTITSLELLKYNDTTKLLVVCPNNAIKQWHKNILEHTKNYMLVEFKPSWGSDKIEEYLMTLSKDDNLAIVINYEMVYRIPYLLELVDKDWSIIVDEMHRIKNYGTKKKPVLSTRFILKLGQKTIYKIGLTATPTQGLHGAYIDYYTQLKFLGYIDMDYEDFYEKYVMYEKKSFGTSPFPTKVIVGYKYTQEIEDILKLVAKRYTTKYGDFEPVFNKVMIERAKSYAKLTRDKAYVKDDIKILCTNSSRFRIAKKTLTTGTIIGQDMERHRYKYNDNDHKLAWLNDFLVDTDEVVSIFYRYDVERDNLVELCRKLNKKFIVIDGNAKDKYTMINNGGYDVVIGQFQAMSEAIDGLHNHCHIEVFFAMPESSIHYIQSIGRIDRIGQTKVPMYYFLIMEKTIDEVIMKNIEDKVEFSEAILDLLEV
jgi:hypothetical protein